MKNQFKEKFLKSNFIQLDLEKIVKDCYFEYKNDNFAYQVLVSNVGSQKNKEIINYDFSKLFLLVYSKWYQHFSNIDKTQIYNSEFEDLIVKITNKQKFAPEKMTAKSCLEFFNSSYATTMKNSGILLAYHSQSSINSVKKNHSKSGYCHISPYGHGNIELRFYLNIQPQNVIEVSELLLNKYDDKRQNLYFKFSTNDDKRNDNFVIYSNYNDAQYMVDLLKEIRRERPDLFLGSENINPLLCPIDNFIGFGEQPNDYTFSFNGIRAKAINMFLADRIKHSLIRIGNFEGVVQKNNNEKIPFYEYIKNVLLTKFLQTIKTNIDKNKKYEYTDQNKKSITDFNKEIWANVGAQFQKGVPNYINMQLENMFIEIMKTMKGGTSPTLRNVLVNIDSNKLSSKCIKQLSVFKNKNGEIAYPINIDFDCKDFFERLFKFDKKIINMITNEKLKPYFNMLNISTKYPYLNYDTEMLILNENGNPNVSE